MLINVSNADALENSSNKALLHNPISLNTNFRCTVCKNSSLCKFARVIWHSQTGEKRREGQQIMGRDVSSSERRVKRGQQ